MDSTLPQKKFAIKIKDVLSDYSRAIFLFGSLARGDGDEYSDVDMFVLTDKNTQDILGVLSHHYKNITLLKNELIIKDCDITCECYIIADINECAILYKGSMIKDVRKSVLLGGDDICSALDGIVAQNTFDYNSEREAIDKKLDYYLERLFVLLKRGDEYRYYFFVNLIIHKVVQLRVCQSGKYFSLYLPRMAASLITSKEWDLLIYKVGSDMETHYKKFLQVVATLRASASCTNKGV